MVGTGALGCKLQPWSMLGLNRTVLVALGLTLLTACGGGGSARAVPGSPNTQSAARQPVTITIDVPKSSGASNHRHPQYISPATTELTVNIQSGCPGACAPVSGYPKTVGLTPTSSGCTSTLASTQCVLTLALEPGNYVGTFTTIDPAVNTLSTATNVAVNVVAGANNVIAVSLSGVPASLIASVLSTGGATTTMLVSALDADSNIIVGAGAPSFAIAQSGSAVGLTQPTTASPNVFTVSAGAAGTTQLTITASYGSGATNACGGTIGGVCTLTQHLTSTGSTTLFVLNNYTATSGVLGVFPLPLGGAASNTEYLGQGPIALAFDASGNVYVTNDLGGSYGSSVNVYGTQYTGVPIQTISSGLLVPHGIAFDSHENLFVSDTHNQNVVEYAPPYTAAPIATIGGAGDARGLAIDAKNDVFVSDFLGGAVREYAPPYTALTATIRTGLANPYALTIAPNGNLFVADVTNGFNEYAPPYAGAPIATAVVGTDALEGVALDALGNLYVSDYTANKLLTMAPPYTGTFSQVPVTGLNRPEGIGFLNAYTVTIGP